QGLHRAGFVGGQEDRLGRGGRSRRARRRLGNARLQERQSRQGTDQDEGEEGRRRLLFGEGLTQPAKHRPGLLVLGRSGGGGRNFGLRRPARGGDEIAADPVAVLRPRLGFVGT